MNKHQVELLENRVSLAMAACDSANKLKVCGCIHCIIVTTTKHFPGDCLCK